jgi:hypothetical protein
MGEAARLPVSDPINYITGILVQPKGIVTL